MVWHISLGQGRAGRYAGPLMKGSHCVNGAQCSGLLANQAVHTEGAAATTGRRGMCAACRAAVRQFKDKENCNRVTHKNIVFCSVPAVVSAAPE